MKTFFVSAALTLATPAWARDLYVTTMTSNANQVGVSLVDRGTIAGTSTLRAWTYRGVKVNTTPTVMVNLSEFDCVNRRERDVQTTSYDLQGQNARVTQPSDWYYVIPSSNGALELDAVCVKDARFRLGDLDPYAVIADYFERGAVTITAPK